MTIQHQLDTGLLKTRLTKILTQRRLWLSKLLFTLISYGKSRDCQVTWNESYCVINWKMLTTIHCFVFTGSNLKNPYFKHPFAYQHKMSNIDWIELLARVNHVIILHLSVLMMKWYCITVYSQRNYVRTMYGYSSMS